MLYKKFSFNLTTRQSIYDVYFANETQYVNTHFTQAPYSASQKAKSWDYAHELVQFIRKNSKLNRGVDALLNEFSLSSEEGIVLMCIAEALLRVPDILTQNQLIQDKIIKGKWSSHLGNSHSLFVNASAWGLLITGKLTQYVHEDHQHRINLLQKSIGKLGEPVIRKAMHVAMAIMGKQFVMGADIESAIKRSQDKGFSQFRYSFDMLGEGARTVEVAAQFFQDYQYAIDAIAQVEADSMLERPGISIKLSALSPRYEFAQHDKVMQDLLPKVKMLALQAQKADISFNIDAEEANRLLLSLDIIEALIADPEITWGGFGIVVQAYQFTALSTLDWFIELARKHQKKVLVRLVKGAYWDAEIKQAQQLGLQGFPVFTRKVSTDCQYLLAAKKLLTNADIVYPQFATHNAYTAATIIQMANEFEVQYEFQRLHGMGDALFEKITQDHDIPCRVYAPVGVHQELLAYLVRRLLENGANSSFVNAILDESKPISLLLTDPFEKINSLDLKENPNIHLASALFLPGRKNSNGIDLSFAPAVAALAEDLNRFNQPVDRTQFQVLVKSPANHDDIVGGFSTHNEDQLLRMLDKASEVQPILSSMQPKDRAERLFKLADLLEAHRAELIYLCIKEAGKVTQDAIDEIREAVDFCRYYAEISLKHYALCEPLGTVLCISPWNFPLAIFLGQIAAALATGNTVIAKPAEQTILIAQKACTLIIQAGFTEGTVQLAIAEGSQIGQVLVPHSQIQAVMFTGSTATGQVIANTLLARDDAPIPLIAETGGQNCMVVDSTALIEQVVDDVIHSGFQSAGQRCSALRVLFIQDDIADELIHLLKGAMQALVIGDPQYLSTDIGPVIDQKALDALNQHVDYLADKGILHYVCRLPDELVSHNTFFAPRLYEINDLSVLKNEVFGPCVHLIRFKQSEIDHVVESINNTGFGLTMGIHSRIEGRCDKMAHAIKAGNIYINRNMIGAIVGSQPFGGHGLSGTGPKAGGPDYLSRLVKGSGVVSKLSISPVVPEVDEPVDHFFDDAESALSNWANLLFEERANRIRLLNSRLAENQWTEPFIDDIDQVIESNSQLLNTITEFLQNPNDLPGPTGEQNRLVYEARGVVLLHASLETDFLSWMKALLAIIATGNAVVTLLSAEFQDVASTFFEQQEDIIPKGLVQVVNINALKNLLLNSKLALLLTGDECAAKQFICSQLIQREGALLNWFNIRSPFLTKQLLLEKTISIDTTAAGGNADLMTLDSSLE